MHLYPIDGAPHDVGADETAWAYRDAVWSGVIAGVDPDPANAGKLRDWCVGYWGYWEAQHPYSAGGAYVNFMMDESQERVQATYGPHYDRLAAIKGHYDPPTCSTSTRTSGRRRPAEESESIATRRIRPG